MNLKKIGKVFTSKFVGTGPSSYKKEFTWARSHKRLRNPALDQSSEMNNFKARLSSIFILSN